MGSKLESDTFFILYVWKLGDFLNLVGSTLPFLEGGSTDYVNL